MSASNIAIVTPTPEAAPAGPPEDFKEFKAWSERQEKGEAEPAVKPTAAPEEKPAEAEAKPAGDTSLEAETAPEAETGEEEEQEEGQEETPAEGQQAHGKRKGGYQKKIERLDRRLQEVQGENATLRERLAALEAAGATKEKPAEKAPEKTPTEIAGKPKPKLKDFLSDEKDYEQSVEEFTDALTEWKYEQKEAVKTAQQREAEEKQQAEAYHATLKEDYEAGRAACKKAHADYDERLEEVADVILSPFSDYALFEHPNGPELAYHLARSRSELEEYAKAQTLEAARIALRKIAKRITPQNAAPRESTSPSAPKGKVTTAPKPIEPVGGGASGGTPSIYDDKLASNYTAWRKAYSAQKDR